MDPTEVELTTINTLDDARTWTATDTAVGDALLLALGRPTLLREVVLIPKASWDRVVTALQVPDGQGAGGTRLLSPAEEARVISLRRCARLRCGLPASDDPVVAQAPQQAPPGAQGPPAQLALLGAQPQVGAAAGGTRTVKMSSIIDQAMDAPIAPLDGPTVRRMYSDYETRQGAEPGPDVEPSSDQLSALHQLLGADAVPYADFAVWGPHGIRMLKKLAFSALVLGHDGNFTRVELKGPGSFDVWWQCWRVYRTAMLLLEACPVEHLDNYAEHIRKASLRYGQSCWFIVYQADVRMRSEHLERIRRRQEREHLAIIAQNGASTYATAKPWQEAYRQSIEERQFWDDELREPATLYLNSVKSRPEVAADGTAHPEIAEPGLPSGPTGSLRDAPSKRPRDEKDSKASGADRGKPPQQVHYKTSEGKDICKSFNLGSCSRKGAKRSGQASKCTRAHACFICLKTHPAVKCPQRDQRYY